MIEGVKDRLEGIASLFVKTKAALSQGGLPKEFINRFGQHVTGFLSGFDRVRFRATLRPLFCPNGPEVYLNYCKVLIKNFKSFALDLSDRLKKLAYEKFEQLGRANIYLPSSELSKETLVEGFEQAQQLQKLYPKFLRHAISTFQSPDVLRFLGRKVTKSTGGPRTNFQGEVNSRLQHRVEGVRIRHTLNANSLKMYDKESRVLRVETTIVAPKEFRIYRAKEGQPKGQKRCRVLRKGVCDMYRCAQLSRAANQRYLEA